MKKMFLITALVLFTGAAFGQTPSTTPVDMEAEKAALNEFMDKLFAAMQADELETWMSFLTEDALVCGTDPSEFWNKEEFKGLWDQDPPIPRPEINYINDRRIKVAPGASSGVVVTQYIISWSPNIPWRQVYHCIKVDDSWMIDFINIAFVPKNEDIQTINAALE
jgi:hypothetical protein